MTDTGMPIRTTIRWGVALAGPQPVALINYEKILLASVADEVRDSHVRLVVGEFGWDVGIDEVSFHSTMSRPGSLSRSKLIFKPRSGAKSSTISRA